MNDITTKISDKSNFITGYTFVGDKVKVNYADSTYKLKDYSVELIEELENKMKTQVLDPKRETNLNKKMSITNLAINTSLLLSFGSVIASGAFVVLNNKKLSIASLAVSLGFILMDSIANEKKKKLEKKQEELEKYRLIAENLDLLNDSYTENYPLSRFTMNNADRFDTKSIKFLIKQAKH